MLKSCWPYLPFSLDHLTDLSDEPEIFLCVSKRTLYVLQNAVIDRLVDQDSYSESIVNEYYVPTRPDLDDYALYISVAQDLARDIVEVPMTPFDLTLNQAGDVASVVYLARYAIAGNLVFVDVLVGASQASAGGYPISLRGFPAQIKAKYATLIGHGLFYDAGVGYRALEVLSYGAEGGTWVFICDGASNYLGLDPASVLAAGDAFYLSLRYEI